MSKPSTKTKQRGANAPSQEPPQGKLSLWKALGPGLITGASDDDPSGIATYSQVGAQFGYGMLWTMLFSYPLMSGIQAISALIGRVTGRGIAANMRGHFPAWLMMGTVFIMLVANIVNLAADIGAMGAAASLMFVRGSSTLYAAGFALLSLVLIVFVPYHRYVFFLKWLTLVLFAYVMVVFVVHVPWGEALQRTVIPSFKVNKDFVTSIVAVLGTTISPYLFFWQASQEVEEERINPDEKPLRRAPAQAAYQIPRIRLDTWVGMAFSNLVAFFIILAVAATLHAKGVTDIQTAQQAAEALEPVGGKFAFILFSLGIIGTGLLAIPVLAGSAAYAVGEALRWPVGLEREPLQARGFYGVLTVAMILGVALNLFHFDPIKGLFWSAVLNGVVAGPVMIVMMLMSSNKNVMGEFTVSRPLKITGWIATTIMLLCLVGMLATSF